MFRVYMLKKKGSRKGMYTGRTTKPYRLSARLAAARSGKRNEPVNRQIQEIGEENVIEETIGMFTNEKLAKEYEEYLIATITHISLGGKNVRRT